MAELQSSNDERCPARIDSLIIVAGFQGSGKSTLMANKVKISMTGEFEPPDLNAGTHQCE